MSESSKVTSPALGGQAAPPTRTRDNVGLVLLSVVWLLIFAYGVYIKTI